MEVKQIEAKDTENLRSIVLRPGRPLTECIYPGDVDDSTLHFAVTDDGKIISIASFYLENHPDIHEPFQYRLRGMATDPKFQKRGMSSALLKTAFTQVIKNNVKVVWCNARASAVEFYKKIGFEVASSEFQIESIGPHFMMKKNLY